MALSLREERRLRTSQSIVAAALGLFSEHGYGRVTVGEIAAAAGVGERTLYRYFADKEELLFAEDEELRAALRAGIEAQPAGAAPFAALRGASAAVADALQDRREELRRRAEVVASAPALTAREEAKHAQWASVLADALVGRGVASGEAALLGRVAVACYNEAMSRWLTDEGQPSTLVSRLDATFAELGALVDRGDE